MRELLENTAERAIAYLEKLDKRKVIPSTVAVAELASHDEPLPDGPSSPESVVEWLDSQCSPATTAMAGPRFFGFVIGGVLPAALAANWLTAAWDQNTGLYAPTPATAQLEQISLRWLVDLFGLPRNWRRLCDWRHDGKLLCSRSCATRGSGKSWLERRG